MRTTRSCIKSPTDRPRRPARRRGLRARPGMALLNAMLIMALFTMMLATGISFTQQSYKAARQTRTETQVYNVARAGLVDAINWFKREATQPVRSFKPLYNAAVPTKGATNDPYLIDPGQAGGKLDPSDSGGGPNDKPSLGIVQEYPLDTNANIYARYEIGKITKLERGSDGKLNLYSIMEQDNTGAWVRKPVPDAKSTEWEGVQDVTAENGLQGQGLVWRIRCHAYIYKKDPQGDPAWRFYQGSNEVLDQIELETEIRRLQVNDYLCAIHANGLGGTTVRFNNGNKVKVVAPDGYGLVYCGGTVNGTPSFTTGAMGSTKVQPGDSMDWGEMFALPDAEALAAIADFKISNVSQLPTAMSTMAITYIKPAGGTATFNQQRPLNGGGLLVCDGNLTIAQGSASTFAGVIYVTGNYNQSSPSAISGQVIVKGSSLVESPSDTANVEYNPSIINEIRRQLGQYRERRTGVRVTSP